MIIHLDWKVPKTNQTMKEQHDLLFHLPAIFFRDDLQICIKQCLIVWNEPVNPVYGFINSTIIDKSPLNPTQELLAFCQHKKSNYLLHTPVHTINYKIQRRELQAAEFKLTLSEKQVIKRVKILLEITNAVWNQSFTS